MKIKTGATIGGWKLLQEIGRGGNGQVWLVEKEGKKNALKILTNAKGVPLERFK